VEPLCDAPAPSSVRDRAVQAALRTEGHWNAQDTGDAAYFSGGDWAPGPYGEWSGDCIKLTVAAYLDAGLGRIPSAGSAAAMYRTYLNRGPVHAGTGPVGALVFWPNAAGGTGHVALSLGDGRVVTTNGYDTNRKVNSIRPASYFSTAAGWALPPGS
jgi:hypothetical protein